MNVIRLRTLLMLPCAVLLGLIVGPFAGAKVGWEFVFHPDNRYSDERILARVGRILMAPFTLIFFMGAGVIMLTSGALSRWTTRPKPDPGESFS
jgi:hypothetical protein